MATWLRVLVVTGLLAAACGSSPVPSTAHQPAPTATSVNGIARCDPTATHPSAPAAWYRDTPKYVGNEQPADAVRAWASTKPGFQTIWIDREHNGWVAAGFDRDVEARQQEILEQFPGEGVVAVLVDWNLAELRQLQHQVTNHLADQGVTSFATAASTQMGLVQISFGVLTEDRMAAIASFAGEPICVEGLDPAQAILDGPQPEAGEGWRLLTMAGMARSRGERPTPPPGPPPTPGGIILGKRVELATTDSQLTVMWADPFLALTNTARPQVDFTREIVVLVSDIESGSCPIRFDGIRVEPDRLALHQVVPDTYTVCTADANTIVYAIAIERAALPTGPFSLDGPTTLWVDADLSVPGASVPDDATFAPPNTPATPAPLPPGFQPNPRPTAPLPPGVGPAQPAPPPAAFPIIVEPGFASTYQLPSTCFVSLGPVNGYVWQIGDVLNGGGPPDEWLTMVDPAGQLQANFLLRSNDGQNPTLDVTVGGRTETYRIADDALPTC